MAVLGACARPMLASIFIVQGYDTLRRPERVAARAEKVVGPLKERVDALPDDTDHWSASPAEDPAGGGLSPRDRARPRLSA